MTTRPDSWQAARDLVKERGYHRRDEPFTLASGKQSHDYIDGKYAIDRGDRLSLVAGAVAELAAANGIEYDAVGGLTMGADPLAIGIAVVTGKHWFSVRKARKDRGHNQWVEGSRLRDAAMRVLLVDDVVSTGGSILQAYRHVTEDGGVVTGAIPMVDRGETAAKRFAEIGVPYLPLMTYADLGIEPI